MKKRTAYIKLVSKNIFHQCTRVLATVLGVISLCVLFACAPGSASDQLEEGLAGGAGTESTASAVAITWTPETDCSACHQTENESTVNPAYDSSLHAAMACIDCHDDTEGLSRAHEGATTADRMPMRLKRTAIDEASCVECHVQDEAFLEKTAKTPLVDAEGTAVNPHNLFSAAHAEITCGDCHKMHSDSSERMGRAQKLCQTCHHSGVYECYTCHEQK
jgi:hypothetical protein